MDKVTLSSFFNKELKKHTMKESYAEVIIPIGDMSVTETKFNKTLLFGKLLDDLDVMSGKKIKIL
jgi:hypothetical protein